MKTSNLKIKKFTLVDAFKESVWPTYECISLDDFIEQLKKHPDIKEVKYCKYSKRVTIAFRPKFKRWPWRIWVAEIKGDKIYPLADDLRIAQISVKSYLADASFYDQKAKEYASLLDIYPEMALEIKSVLDRYKDKYKHQDLIQRVEKIDRTGHICFNET